jgi:hypothetical protein
MQSSADRIARCATEPISWDGITFIIGSDMGAGLASR